MSSTKSPLELAALATAAIPGLRVAGLRPPQFSDEVLSVTGIIDTSGNRWTVVSPHDTVGGLDLEAQTSVLSRLARAHGAGRIPFEVPRPAGFTTTPEGGRIMVHREIGGRFMDEDDFTDAHVLPASLGRSLAALHNLPEAVYTGIDLPAYTAAECRDRDISILDEAARATVIPANLWNRWEAALEDLSLWRFRTTPVHGDLQMTSVFVEEGCVLGLTGFSSAHVGDPATDAAWVLAQASEPFLDRFRESYSLDRSATDLHLFTRAQLLSELAIVRWLVHGVHAEDDSIIEDARHMLADLSTDLGDDQLVHARSGVSIPDASTSEAVDVEPIGSTGVRRSIWASGIRVTESARGITDGENSDESSPATGPLSARELPTEQLHFDDTGRSRNPR